MDVLHEAGLMVTHAKERVRENSLNAVPIRQMAERWISPFDAFWVDSLLRVKEDSET